MANKRAIWLTTLLVLLIFAVMSVVVYRTSFLTRTRTVYQPYDLRAPAFTEFYRSYTLAQSSAQGWDNDPRQVALRLVGYPKNAAIAREGMKVLPARRRHFTVLIAEPATSNAAIAAREHRVDLVQKEERWEVEWAGERWRCAPGRGHQDLSTEPCS